MKERGDLKITRETVERVLEKVEEYPGRAYIVVALFEYGQIALSAEEIKNLLVLEECRGYSPDKVLEEFCETYGIDPEARQVKVEAGKEGHKVSRSEVDAKEEVERLFEEAERSL